MSEPARPHVVLASSSRSRRRILEAAGIAFEVVPSAFEESWALTDDPATTVTELARGKARDVAPRFAESYVLGCDSLFAIDGTILGKAHTPEEATERWQSMGGRSGVLHTGHVLIHRGIEVAEAVATTVTFVAPDPSELEAYVATRESIGVAGGFTLEGRSSAFITAIDGDASNVLGLSVACLRRLLRAFGIAIFDVWA